MRNGVVLLLVDDTRWNCKSLIGLGLAPAVKKRQILFHS